MTESTTLQKFCDQQTAALSRAQETIQRLEAALIAAEAVNAERLKVIEELQAHLDAARTAIEMDGIPEDMEAEWKRVTGRGDK